MLRIARVLVLTVAVAGPAVAFAGEKVVHLDVDGRVRPVRTYASSAPDLLRRKGIEPGSRAVVRPGGRLAPGTRVTVRRARPIQLFVDGRVSSVWVHGLTVGEALRALGVRLDGPDFLFPEESSPLVDGMPVLLRNAVHATVTADGRTRDIVTSAGSVGDALRAGGVRVGARDVVRPARDAAVTPGMRIVVVRVGERFTEQRVALPYSHRERADARLEKGRRRVVQKGAEGLKIRRYALRMENGRPAGRRLVSERVVRPPRDEIVAVGTGQPGVRSTRNAQEGLASWYRFEGLGAAHRTLPMGTVVRVTNLAGGRSVNVVIRDRGPFVEGRIIDLSEAAFAELAPLGAGTIRVRIEW